MGDVASIVPQAGKKEKNFAKKSQGFRRGKHFCRKTQILLNFFEKTIYFS
jgi:hypothetical protein